MPVVMDLHGLRVDVRLERIEARNRAAEAGTARAAGGAGAGAGCCAKAFHGESEAPSATNAAAPASSFRLSRLFMALFLVTIAC